MSLKTLQNFYKQTVSQTWETGTGIRYVSVKPTPSEGWLVVSPSNTSLREIVYYSSTGTDSTGDYVVLSQRGLGGTSDQTHNINEPIRMNFTAQHQQEISDAIDQIVAAGAQDASTSTKGIAKLSVAPASATEPIAVGTNDPRVPTADPTTIFSLKKFGGTGADGALAITSGTTTIDLASAQIVVKNYTSISITGTGKLTFSNPHNNGTVIVLKSQGNVTLTSSTAPMIDASGMGALNTTDGYGIGFVKSYAGGDSVAYNTPGAGGVAPTTLSISTAVKSTLASRYPLAVPGAGGGSNGNKTSGPGGGGSVIGAGGGGSTGFNSFSTNGFTGGRGGGALIIECGGYLNFTTSSGISVAGKNGQDGTGTYDPGSAGGGAGACYLLYNSLTANSGTITVSGGTHGTPQAPGGTPGDGASGYSLVAQNTEFA